MPTKPKSTKHVRLVRGRDRFQQGRRLFAQLSPEERERSLKLMEAMIAARRAKVGQTTKGS